MIPRNPRLMYHNLAPALYPEGDGDENVLAIRFTTPVRVSSLRIVPEGVGSISGIGSTYPTTFTAKVLLNTSPSDPEPVNALNASEIEYDGRDGWEQDYEIGMPEGVSTRMMLVVGKFDRLSISVYGYDSVIANDGIEKKACEGDATVSAETVKVKENWGWISGWAGGVQGLLDMLDDTDTDTDTDQHSMHIRQRVLDCLDLQCDVDPTSLDLIVNHPTALSYLLLLPSYPPQPILQRLFREPKYALHPAVRHHLPPKHAYRPLVDGTNKERRRAAWRLLPDSGAMIMLHELGVGDWDEEVTNGQSRMARLMEVLQTWHGDTEGYERGLDLLFNSLGEDRDRPVRERYLASIIPALIVRSRLLGSDRMIGQSELYKREILAALAKVMSNLNEPSTQEITIQLAQPFLPLAPYDLIFQSPGTKAVTLSSPTSEISSDPLKRAEERFITALDHPLDRNGYVHSLTPSQILSSIAPNLLESLSTARNPPFGIRTSASSQMMGVGGSSTSATASASTFAGKVYSSHEFRTREISNNKTSQTGGEGMGIGMGMGMSSGSGSGSGSGAGAGLGVGAGAGAGAGAGGLGVHALKASRPASRHVDEYAR